MDSERKRRGDRNTLHAISFLRECLNDQFFVILPPSFVIGNNIDLRSDIFSNIFLVSGLVMEGDAERRQRLETDTDVYLRPTGDMLRPGTVLFIFLYFILC